MVGDIRDTGSIPGLGRSPGGGYGNPLQYSGLENPMDRGAWQAMVHRIAKSQTQLKRFSTHSCDDQISGSPAPLLCSQVSACPPVPGHVTPISSMNPWNRIQCLLRRLWERGLVHSSHPKINPLSVNRSTRAKRKNSLNSPSERKLQRRPYISLNPSVS